MVWLSGKVTNLLSLRKRKVLPKKYLLPLFLVLQVLLVRIASFFPSAVEAWYSNGFYPHWSTFERTLTGWLPFSLGDVLYGLCAVLSLRWIWRHRKGLKGAWKDRLLVICSACSVLYFCFHLSWALNYYRIPLREKLGLKKDFTEAQLVRTVRKLIDATNSVQLGLTHDPGRKVVFPYTRSQVFRGNVSGYRRLSETDAALRYDPPSVKASLISLPLTYMGFSGYLNPFTGEAQVNGRIPMYQMPMTSAHEMAHQLGFASESEANFIGFEATISHDDPYYRYSGYAFALRYCLSALEALGEGKSKPFLKDINPGILENYRDSRKFWDSYQTFVESGFKVFYDRFLKMNSQRDGMEGYSRFVNLLVNYYDEKEL
jgi:hypothetical protein